MKRPDEASSGVPSKYRTLYLRALAGQLSPRQAIKAKCQECCGWEDVSSRVGGCTVRTCPLWPLRPYQEVAEAAQRCDRRTSAEEPDRDGLSAVRDHLDTP
jgi:hypothetical protein